VSCLTAHFAQHNSVADVDWAPSLKIRQPEGSHSISSVRGAQDGKEGLILIDGQQLPIAKSPSLGGEVPTDNLNFAQKWL
jgi:hypothetical protein